MVEFVILTAMMMSIVSISIDAMMPALGLIGSDLHATYGNQAQLVLVFIFVGLAFGQLVCGPLSDAMGRRKILFAGLAVFLTGSVICFFAQNMTTMLAGRLIQGLGIAGPYVTAVAVVRDRFSGRDMARIMSLVMTIFILVPAIAPSLGQGILAFFHWRMIFAMYVVYAMVLGLWIFLRLPETLNPKDRIAFSLKSVGAGFRAVIENRSTASYTLCMGLIFAGFIGYLNSCQQIFQDLFNTGNRFALYFGGLALVLGVASLLNARLVAMLGMHKICHVSTQGIIAASVVFLALNLLMPVSLWMFLVYMAVLFFGFGLMFGNLNAIAMEPMGHIAGIASAVIGFTSSVISLVVGGIIGQIYDGTVLPITVGFLILNIMSLAVMLYERRRAAALP